MFASRYVLGIGLLVGASIAGSVLVPDSSHSCEKSRSSVNALAKVVGFLRVLRFPPGSHIEC